eukprot:14918353-Ditylum_brightwellii.AAC.1
MVGMLMYLSATGRLNISTAIHQCAYYSHNCRQYRKKVVKRIVHYLIGTQDTHPRKTGFRGLWVMRMTKTNLA